MLGYRINVILYIKHMDIFSHGLTILYYKLDCGSIALWLFIFKKEKAGHHIMVPGCVRLRIRLSAWVFAKDLR